MVECMNPASKTGCSEFPGHSACKKRIAGGSCPSLTGHEEGCTSRYIVSRRRHDGVHVESAEQLLRVKKEEGTHVCSFVAQPA